MLSIETIQKLNIRNAPSWKINIDTGGTFTDCLAVSPQGMTTRIKVLSSARLRGRIVGKVASRSFKFESSWQFGNALLVGFSIQFTGSTVIAKITSIDFETELLTIDSDLEYTQALDFELYTGEEAPVFAARLLTQTPLSAPLPTIDMRLGTTKGTNALLERKGARTLLVVNRGFKDLLYIGNQQRPSLFQLHIPEPSLLYTDVLEIDARLDANGVEIQPLDVSQISIPDLEQYESVAISLLHSYKNSAHELIRGLF